MPAKEIYLYNCPTSAISKVFEIPADMHGVFQIYDLPAGWCVNIEEELCPSGCDLEYYPLLDDCHEEVFLTMDCADDRKICLPCGRYRAIVSDENDDPVTPSEGDIRIRIGLHSGPCPTTSG